MDRRDFMSRAIGLGLATGAANSLVGCGTLIHTDRVGQPHSRDIDWMVVGLNGLGLAFFFVPGVVAFAVDFYTGAIYLPPEYEEYSPASSTSRPAPAGALAPDTPLAPPKTSVLRSPNPERKLRQVAIASDELDPQEIETLVSRRLGKQVKLLEPDVRASSLARLEDFSLAYQQHTADPKFGFPSRQFFARRTKV